MGKAFNGVMQIVSTLLGLLMICLGGVWILQGLNIAFLDSFMAGDPQWALWGAILALFGVGQAIKLEKADYLNVITTLSLFVSSMLKSLQEKVKHLQEG